MHFKNKITPYENKELDGIVCETWLRGKQIYSKDTGFDELAGPIGSLLLEKRQEVEPITEIVSISTANEMTSKTTNSLVSTVEIVPN